MTATTTRASAPTHLIPLPAPQPPANAGSRRRPTEPDPSQVRSPRRQGVCRRTAPGGGTPPTDPTPTGTNAGRSQPSPAAAPGGGSSRGGVDVDRPSVARIYDYLLGGAHNVAADRDAAEQALTAAPHLMDAVWADRAFRRRAIRHALEAGIRQFLDLGSGIPTIGAIHDSVHAVAPHAGVVYVDDDPIVNALTRALLADNGAVSIVRADIRDTSAILNDPAVTGLIDFDRPTAVLLTCVLHFLPGDISHIVAELCRPLAAGSHLIISHATTEAAPPEAVQQMYARTTTPLHLRSHDQVRAVLDGLDIVHPDLGGGTPADLVPVTRWRPEPGDDPPTYDADAPMPDWFLAAVGRRPPPRPTTPRPPRL
jgi:O-methyltransferase involved in polyketide biosynthesis